MKHVHVLTLADINSYEFNFPQQGNVNVVAPFKMYTVEFEMWVLHLVVFLCFSSEFAPKRCSSRFYIRDVCFEKSQNKKK